MTHPSGGTSAFLDARQTADMAVSVLEQLAELDGANKLAVLAVARAMVEARRDAELFRLALAVHLGKQRP